MAHEVGSGPGGFLDFREAVNRRIGDGKTFHQDIGVGSDYAEKIIEGMGDDLDF